MSAESPGLIIYRASRLEALLDPLLALMQAAPPERVLAPHSVIAAHPGMQRWLTRALALKLGRHGIAANLRIELPSDWLDGLARDVLGAEAIDVTAYRSAVLRWRVHECLGGIGDVRVAAYLGADGASRAQRRFQLADRLARIYSRYLVYRPDWLRDWADGRGGAPVDPLLTPLWKLLRRRIGRPHRGEILARLPAVLDGAAAPALREDPLHVFGIAHLAPSELAVLRAVARHRPVVLYVPDPCREFWGGLRSERARLRERVRTAPDAAETEGAFLEQAHPLLAAWGRMGQHFVLALDESGARIDERHWRDANDAPQLDTRLHRVQESIRQLAPALIAEHGGAAAARADASLRVHACHTRLRELEVLRDALLRARRDDASLKPSDIVVMMPDVQGYLPLLPTVFGVAGRHDGPLPYHCFDVSVARTHSLFGAFRQLLDLPLARVTAPEVADLLGVPEIARRLGLGAGDADLVSGWLQRGRVAWALDAEFRARFEVPAIAEHTFAWGVDRLLAGYLFGNGDDDEAQAMAPGDGSRVVPVEGVHGPQAALLGALDTLLVEVGAWCAAAAAPRPASGWSAWFEQRLDNLFAIDPTDAEARDARAALRRMIATVEAECADSGLDPALDFSVVRDVLLDRLDTVHERQRFLLGGVTFCGMVPQRSIPFRVIAVLGLNDGEYPRSGSDGGLDLMNTQRRLGDRDVRSDDRYLFLETLMSARDRLHLSYVGEGVRDGKPRNPAAPLAELIAALDAAASADATLVGGETPAQRERRLRPWFVRHPLQPFDARYFDGEDTALYSFDAALAALRGETRATGPAPFVASGGDSADAAPEPTSVDLRELAAYYKDPAKQILAGALNLRLDAVDEFGLRDSEALEARVEAIDQVAKRLFNEAVVGADLALPDAPPDWLRLTGVLPPGRAGDEAWKDELDAARGLVAVAAQHELFAGGRPLARPLRIEQAIETRAATLRLRGELRRVFDKNGVLWVAECYPHKAGEDELDFKPRIPFFIEWALLRLATPADTPVRACVVLDGKPGNWQRSFDAWDERLRKARASDAEEMRADLARRVAGLVGFWRRSLRAPQWYFPVTSWTLLNEGPQKARERWFGGAYKKTAERDYAPGYAALLGRDTDLFDGANLAQMHANALRLRTLIDLDRPLKERA